MSEPLRIEAEIGADHRLTAVVPSNVPPGRVEVTVHLKGGLSERQKKARLLALAGTWKDVAFERLPQDPPEDIAAW